MTLNDETVAEWCEDAEYDGLANGDGGRTPEYTVDARRIIALADALTEERDRTSRLQHAMGGIDRAWSKAEAKLARVRDLAETWSQHVWGHAPIYPECDKADELRAVLDGEGGGDR